MKRKSILFRIGLGFLLILCLLIQVGCGLTESQRRNTTNFSNTTVALSTLASKELIEMRNGVIQMNTYGLTAVGEDAPLPKIDGIEQTFTAKAIKVRI